MAGIAELRAELNAVPVGRTPQYVAKQLHPIPAAPVVEREVFVLERVRGRRVLEFGASGPMHEAIKRAASTYGGVDKEDGDRIQAFDLDAIFIGSEGFRKFADFLPRFDAPEIVVCGEVLEHLGNPQWFLTRLRRQYAGVPVIITVPNAFTDQGHKAVARGIENVNRDHVAWYSYRTLTTLLERVGYVVTEFAWYKGHPRTAEGLIVVVR